jgi:hypothetical protein
VHLSETAALGLAAACQVGSYCCGEKRQQRERAHGSPTSRRGGNQRGRHGQLGKRQENPERPHQSDRDTEVNYRLPGAVPVGELRYPGRCENKGQ